METTMITGICLLVLCLMIRFSLGCWDNMKAAMTGYQFFTAILRLALGWIFFPVVLIVQMLEVLFD